MKVAWIGGILGAGIGIIGGIVGTCFSIRNTNGPRERSFMVKACIVGWIAIAIFIVLMLMLPAPYRYLLWIPYGILLPLGIRYGNREQARIRQAESKHPVGQQME